MATRDGLVSINNVFCFLLALVGGVAPSTDPWQTGGLHLFDL